MDPPVAQPATSLEAAQTLNRGQFKRYLRALDAEAAAKGGEAQPSALGRFFKPAKSERKLVLFTLGVIVILIVASVFAIEMWADGPAPASVTTPLVTIAGTGLGFIGGMVSDRKTSSPGGESDATG